jgi:hypothetical protein
MVKLRKFSATLNFSCRGNSEWRVANGEWIGSTARPALLLQGSDERVEHFSQRFALPQWDFDGRLLQQPNTRRQQQMCFEFFERPLRDAK